MTVLLLDPTRPTVLPVDAVDLLRRPMRFTDDVPEQLRRQLSRFSSGDGDPVVVSTTRDDPTVRAALAAGEQLVEPPGPDYPALGEAIEVMDTLRRLGKWESGQTHASLRPYLLEETYEVLDAIDSGSSDELRDELGDLLLQVLFHARIAGDGNAFDVEDVAAALVAKLRRRSPLLSAPNLSMDIAAQESAWQAAKAAEKPSRRSCVDGIATGLPALALASKVAARAFAAGLPSGLVPERITRVELAADGTGDAEGELRRDVLAFMADIRAAERAAAAAGAQPGELSAELWFAHWPRRPESPDRAAVGVTDGDDGVTTDVTEPSWRRSPTADTCDVRADSCAGEDA